jgi:hypothetical protein
MVALRILWLGTGNGPLPEPRCLLLLSTKSFIVREKIVRKTPKCVSLTRLFIAPTAGSFQIDSRIRCEFYYQREPWLNTVQAGFIFFLRGVESTITSS